MAWNHEFVHLDAALSTLEARQGRTAVDWTGVRVAHLDTGYTRGHPVFGTWTGDDSPVILASQGLCLVPKPPPVVPPVDTGIGSGPLRNPWHGTRTGSALAGLKSTEFVGCAPGVPIVPYRVVDDVVPLGDAEWLPIAEALRHAVYTARCNIVSMSLGGFYPHREMGRAVDEAYERGVIMVAAAGQHSDRVTYPGKYARVFGVGGLRRLPNGEIRVYYDYSDHSERVDIWAPAAPITRADPIVPGNAPPIGSGDGTSYATVHVAAAAAIWLRYREAELVPYEGWRRVEAFWHCLNRTASMAKMPVGGNRYVNGVLDARAILDVPLPPPERLNPNWRRAEDENQ